MLWLVLRPSCPIDTEVTGTVLHVHLYNSNQSYLLRGGGVGVAAKELKPKFLLCSSGSGIPVVNLYKMMQNKISKYFSKFPVNDKIPNAAPIVVRIPVIPTGIRLFFFYS
jgi:hypothetical protein